MVMMLAGEGKQREVRSRVDRGDAAAMSSWFAVLETWGRRTDGSTLNILSDLVFALAVRAGHSTTAGFLCCLSHAGTLAK